MFDEMVEELARDIRCDLAEQGRASDRPLTCGSCAWCAAPPARLGAETVGFCLECRDFVGVGDEACEDWELS